MEVSKELEALIERIKAHGGKEAGFSMAEGKAMVDDLMQAAKLTEDGTKTALAENRVLCDTPVDSRDCIALIGVAFAPLLLTLQVGGAFGVACVAQSNGPRSIIFWASVASVLWSVVVYFGIRQQQSQCESQVGPNEGPGLLTRIKTYARRLDQEAQQYRDQTRRAAFCQVPWLMAACVLGLEMSTAATAGRLLEFLQALTITTLAAMSSGAVLGLAVCNELPGPPEATYLEIAAATIARCPAISMCVSSIFALVLPAVEQASPSARELQEMGTGRFDMAEQYVVDVEELRCKLHRRANKVLNPASQLEKAFVGSGAERAASIKELTSQFPAHVKDLTCATTKLAGVGPQGGTQRQQMKETAEAAGELLGGIGGLVSSLANPHEDVKTARISTGSAQQMVRGGLKLLETAMTKNA